MQENYPIPPEFAVRSRVIVTIIDIAFGGEGVARLNDFVIFIPFVLVGEEVDVEITELKKRFARARLLAVIRPSPDRVDPLCPYFGECGGCQYQHMAYPMQLTVKHKQISDLFERVGGFERAAIRPVVPCPQPYYYRNRIMIRSQWDKFKQGLNIGFIRNDNRLVVDIEECKISEPEINRQILHVRQNPPPKGGIKVVLRVPPPGWEVPRDSFFQNNFFLLSKLVAAVRECIEESKFEYLLDVYCGVGFFGIEAADLVKAFVGIELDRLAIRSAQRNASERGIKNGEFIDARVEEALPALLLRYPANRSAVLIDPPRTGAPPEALELLRTVRPTRIIYVSCHPATLARDLNILCQNAVYELVRLTPLDMFPQTQHIECVADLRLRQSDDSGNPPA
ncbi:MAG: methyltransferase, TrmA family [Verrucomicrobiales bacterium]|nr:methyltransferase, TrmA family [Verrucomicrobiales bacterium]